MITFDKSDTTKEIAFKGLSTDTKTTDSFEGMPIVNGSSFFEMDTQDVYFYDGATDAWLDQPS